MHILSSLRNDNYLRCSWGILDLTTKQIGLIQYSDCNWIDTYDKAEVSWQYFRYDLQTHYDADI